MKKILVILAIMMVFIACDYAKESAKLKPDVEITYIHPMGWYTHTGDSTHYAVIDEIDFVAKNSVDCYLKELIWEYYDKNGNYIFGPAEPLAIYAKIKGITNPEAVDTFKLLNVNLPLDTVRRYLSTKHLQSAKAILHFVVMDEYFKSIDTTDVWFGIYLMPSY